MPMIDTLTLKTELLVADMSEPQATAIVGALADADTGQITTKAEMEKLRGDMRKETADLRGDMRKEIADLRGEIKTLHLIGKTLMAFQVLIFSTLVGLLWKVFAAGSTALSAGGS